MQEVLKDGSIGETYTGDRLEDLVPHIKKSLEDPKVAFVKIFRGKVLVAGVMKPDIKKEVRFVVEEEKKKIGIFEDDYAAEQREFDKINKSREPTEEEKYDLGQEVLKDQVEEDKKELKKAQLKIPRKK